MAFLPFLRITILFFLFVHFTFAGSAQQPACKDSFPASLLPNASFEQYSGCSAEYGGGFEGGLIDVDRYHGGVTVPGWHSLEAQTHEIHYYNYNCRINDTISVFDPPDPACFLLKVPRPLPDSTGFISIFELFITSNPDAENEVLKNYIATCLSQPLYAGQPYVFSFYFGFGRQGSGSCGPLIPLSSKSPYAVAIYGRPDCPDFPLRGPIIQDQQGCLTNRPGWVQLGKVELKGQNQWVQGVIEFTPPVNITSIGIGPSCDGYPNQYESPFYFMDQFILAPKGDFSFKTITALSGSPCTGRYILQAPVHPVAAYQWYRNDTLLAGAVSQTYNVPDRAEAAGRYTAHISLPYDVCLNTLPFTVSFSDIAGFNLGNDTALCKPAQLQLHGPPAKSWRYRWQDGSTNDSFSVSSTGTYWAEATDANGCIKRDSVSVSIENCEQCALHVPSAFTPNGDGLNDVFRALPQCANIGLQHYRLRIYNRWGQTVFTSTDIHTAWDGTLKNRALETGVYIYYIDYAFKKDKPLTQKGTVVLIR